MNYYDFIINTISEAGELLTQKRKEHFTIENKGGDSRDIITSIDNDINNFLIEKIRSTFPEHSIYSEEGGDVDGGGDYMWVLDPIDGTANFSRGIPHFGISLGLLHKGVIIVGAVYNPITKELFSFEKGKGAFLNREKVYVSEIEDLSKAHVFFHAGRKEGLRDWGGESYRRLLGSARKTSNLASSSLDTCFVAAGRIEANIYGTLSTLDIAAAIGILIEAGGVVADAGGNFPEFSREPQKIFMANNPTILNQAISLLEDN